MIKSLLVRNPDLQYFNFQDRKSLNLFCWLVLVIFCLYTGVKYAENISLVQAYGGWSPLDWASHQLMPENFRADFPSGIDAYQMSSFMACYVFLAVIGIDLQNIFPWTIGLEILFLGVSAALLFKAIAHKSTSLAMVIFAVMVIEGSVRSIDLARFGGAFYQGLYYNVADGSRLLGLAFLFRGRILLSAIFLGISCTVHLIMACLACLFAIPYVLIVWRQYKFQRWIIAGITFLLITIIWFGARLETSGMMAGGIPVNAWLQIARMFSFHWFPLDMGVLTTMHTQYILPLLCLVSLSLYYLQLIVSNPKQRLGIALGMALLVVATCAGVLISKFLPEPFLIKLSLHRSSELLALISFLIVAAGLIEEILNSNIHKAALSFGLIFSPLISNPFPVFPVLALLFFNVIKPEQGGTLKQRNLAIGLILVISTVLSLFYVNELSSSKEYLGRQLFWQVVLAIYFLLLIVGWGEDILAINPRVKGIFICITLISMLLAFSIYRVKQNTKMSDTQVKVSSDYLAAQRWASLFTPNNALFMVDPTIYYGWRDFSQRSSYGNLREWLHTSWLYNSRKANYDQGLQRLSEFGINPFEYLNEKPPIIGFYKMSKDLEVKYYSMDLEAMSKIAKKYNISYILMLKDKTRKLTKLEVSFSNDSFIIYHIDIK